MVKRTVEIRQCLVSTFTITLFIIYLIFFTGCSDGDIPSPFEPEEEFTYFESVGDSLQYTSQELIAALMGGEAAGSLPSVFPDIDVKIKVINYHTTDPQGNPVVASGIISYPATEAIRSVVVAEHYTISANREAPSSTMQEIESALSLYRYLVVMPDYIGFGATKALTHPYLHVENTAQVSLDMLFAVREYMASKGISLTDDIYITGYSQGGAAALAVQQLAESNYTSDINVRQVIAGGGPYDLTAIFDSYTETGQTAYPCALPMTIIGLDYGDNLGLDYSNVFIGPLLSHYDEWINSKEYTTGEINNLLGSSSIRDFIHPDLFEEGMNSDFNKLYASLNKNSLTDWRPQAPVFLVHGKNDEVVPYVCAQNAYDSFTSKGCQVELTPANSDHKGTAVTYYLFVLSKLI